MTPKSEILIRLKHFIFVKDAQPVVVAFRYIEGTFKTLIVSNTWELHFYKWFLCP